LPVKNFWRLPVGSDETITTMLANSSLSAPAELFHKIKPGHGIVLASWDNNAQVGHVSALGLVKSVNASIPTADIVWANADITLKPNPSGRQFWQNKPFFRFADSVAVRYMLDDLFSEHFPGIDNISLGQATGVRRPNQERTYLATPGYIYVIKSEYGYKIGKTVNLKSRTSLFSVKLPFPIELVHYAWFENYSQAERKFHDIFSSKRLEGEWFNLSAADIAAIKAHGQHVPVEGL